MATAPDIPQNSPFLKQLASSDTRTRAEALENLRTYLRGHGAFTEMELLKLWKGLFYCMWMCDRARNQQRLAIDLAALVDVLKEENVVEFLEAFWKTMAREWGGVDVLRMDKFLFLVRQYLGVVFGLVLGRKGLAGRCLGVLGGTPLEPTEARIPNGLRYHVLDIYVDELVKADPDRKSTGAELEEILAPVRRIAKDSPTKSVRQRAKETLNDERIRGWSVEEPGKTEVEDEKDGDSRTVSHENQNLSDDEWGGIED